MIVTQYRNSVLNLPLLISLARKHLPPFRSLIHHCCKLIIGRKRICHKLKWIPMLPVCLAPWLYLRRLLKVLQMKRAPKLQGTKRNRWFHHMPRIQTTRHLYPTRMEFINTKARLRFLPKHPKFLNKRAFPRVLLSMTVRP
jgi:hypothetical protein